MPNPFAVDIWGNKPKKRKNISITKKGFLWEKNKSHICHICRKKIYSITEAELDHIRAYSKGGQKVNWSHYSCNRLKGNKSLTQIQRELGIKVKTKKRKSTRKKSKNNYWINPITGRKIC